MRQLFTYFAILVVFNPIFSRTISGKVLDEDGAPLAYVSIYEDGTTNATFSNDEGLFELQTTQSNAVIVFQYFGYKTHKHSLQVDEKTIHIKLEPENFELEEVVIKSNAEDPAYGFMRELIAHKPAIKKAIPHYETDLYIKGMLKMLKAPKAILGNEVGDMSGILDSNRQGILYLSESQSKLYYDAPNTYKEVMIKSIVSGSDNMVSMNQVSTARFDFYYEEIDFFRPLISPCADNAFTYYTFKLENTFYDKQGDKIARIKVIPKSNFRPCFFGEIYVNTSLDAIHSVDLNTTGDALKQSIFDTFTVKQVHVPLTQKDQFALLTQTVDFKVGGFGFKMKGNFLAVFSNYTLEKSEDAHTALKNKNEVYAVTKDAIKNDSAYWNSERPIPLSEEEEKDYIKKDSLQRLWKSESYLDSIDAVGNKFKFMNVLFGYSHDNTYEQTYWGVSPLVSSISFNAVEGTNLSIRPYYRKYSKDEIKRFNINGELRYGLSDKKIKTFINTTYRYNRISLSSVGLSFGRNYLQYDNRGVIIPMINMFESLLGKNHYAKVYEQDFIAAQWSSEISNGLICRISASHAKRSSLQNTSNFSYFNKDKEYQSNIPDGIDEASLNNNRTMINLGLRWVPAQKYMSYPDYRNRLGSNYPTFRLNIDKAIGLINESSDFLKLRLSMEKDRMHLGVFGYSSLTAEYGRFLTNKKSNFIDNFHFLGNETPVYLESDFSNTFLASQYYSLSSTRPYAFITFQHHFEGWMTDKIPLLNNLGVKTVAGVKSLLRSDIKYYEASFGFEGIKIGIINLGRIDYIASFDQTGYRESKIRFGLAAFFEQVVE